MNIGGLGRKSMSPIMHNAGYQELGLDFVYLSASLKIEDLEDFVKGVKAMQIRGVSVIIPFKQEIMNFLDNIDDTAKEIGAVNTVVNDNGRLTGYNTDWLGVVNSLKNVTEINGKKAAVLGAGGAARAAVYGLIKKGARVSIFNRTVEKAKKLAEDFDCEYFPLTDVEKIKEIDIILNMTSVGMSPEVDKLFLPENLIEKKHIVLDAVYNPHETKLLKNANKKGAKIVYGSEMLLHQGIEQFRMYTGVEAPEKIMRDALLEALREE